MVYMNTFILLIVPGIIMHKKIKSFFSLQQKILDNEKDRRQIRIKNAQANDIWEYRSSPPEDWTKPLPEWEKARKNTVLSKVQLVKEKSGTFTGTSDTLSSCVIL